MRLHVVFPCHAVFCLEEVRHVDPETLGECLESHRRDGVDPVLHIADERALDAAHQHDVVLFQPLLFTQAEHALPELSLPLLVLFGFPPAHADNLSKWGYGAGSVPAAR